MNDICTDIIEMNKNNKSRARNTKLSRSVDNVVNAYKPSE